jgi:hypothetical protein
LSERRWHLLNFSFPPTAPHLAPIILHHKMSSGPFFYAPAFVLHSLLVCFYLLFRYACTVVVRHMYQLNRDRLYFGSVIKHPTNPLSFRLG